jgi:transposase InsO family protein
MRVVSGRRRLHRPRDFAHVPRGARHQRITPYTPRHNGKVERYNRILFEEFLYARTWTSESQRSVAQPAVRWRVTPCSPYPRRSPRWSRRRETAVQCRD